MLFAFFVSFLFGFLGLHRWKPPELPKEPIRPEARRRGARARRAAAAAADGRQRGAEQIQPDGVGATAVGAKALKWGGVLGGVVGLGFRWGEGYVVYLPVFLGF